MNSSRLLAVLCFALLTAGLASLSADPAYAEAIRLKTGQLLEAESVEVLENSFRLGIKKNGEVTHVELPFDLAAITPLYTQLLLGVIGTDMPTPLKWLTRALRPHYALSERLGVPTNLIRKNASRGMHLSHAAGGAWIELPLTGTARRTRVKCA